MTARLLWLHGWGVSPHVWGDVSSMLPEYEHHFVSFEQCRTVEDLHSAIITKLTDEKGEWILVGWSMGGMLALNTAFAADRRIDLEIKAVVFISTTLQFIDNDRTKGWPKRIVQRMKAQLAEDKDEVLSNFKQLMLSSFDNENDLIQTVRFTTEFTLAGLQAGLTYLMESSNKEQWQHFLQQDESLPWLWIHGGKDAVCPVGCLPDVSHDHMVVIEDAGHLPFLTHEQPFYKHLRSFLHEHE